jgi:hypothetical protein
VETQDLVGRRVMMEMKDQRVMMEIEARKDQ